ncbi:hypothetical protein CPT03_03225 [Pedobacter ginsengisoli]|uniref:phospholipase D n=1 Tax=Pedobacter ginsengisoli TaxID=363852 RepID=A0A2D1U1Q4_9SPHI|nr:phospholipase D-like domain-containing protein [Pedobacter ginsengisoli]ATP55542.1 hypothetical protein CPT03_03225 [Pedobacter ginsengisoli]
METKQRSYFENIESLIIERIRSAQSSIYIAVAWFTSSPIKDALLQVKNKRPEITIEVVVDDNDVNKKYFLNTQSDFLNAGILIHRNWKADFLHRKFMVIDDLTTLTGSYNYTRKAKFNAENLNETIDVNFAQVHFRVFRRMTDESYFDENMQLLLDYPLFAQKLLSTYFSFSKAQYNSYKNKIVIGDCFTHDVGDYDELSYYPGFIFNRKYKFDTKLRDHEFPLPINKSVIKNWIGSRNQIMIIESYREYPESWDEISDRLEEYEISFEKFYKNRLESTYTYEQLKDCIERDVDIIVEDRIWSDNFALFMDDNIIDAAFDKMPEAENNYWNDFAIEVEKIMRQKKT